MKSENPTNPRMPAARTVLFGVLIAILLALALRSQGRVWWCACGSPAPWSGQVNSSHNSQHLVDPYSFTHVIHGMALFALLWPLKRWLGRDGRALLALALEAGWE